MSFEAEKQGLQGIADFFERGFRKGQFGFGDLEEITEIKKTLIDQHRLLEGGLAEYLRRSQPEIQQPEPIPEPVATYEPEPLPLPTQAYQEPRLAIAQPQPEECWPESAPELKPKKKAARKK